MRGDLLRSCRAIRWYPIDLIRAFLNEGGHIERGGYAACTCPEGEVVQVRHCAVVRRRSKAARRHQASFMLCTAPHVPMSWRSQEVRSIDSKRERRRSMAVIVQGYPKHNQRMKLSGMESQSIGFMPHVNAPLSKHGPAIARPYGLVQTPRGVKEATPVQDLEYIRARVLHYIDADAVLMVWRCGSAVSSPGCTSEAFVWIIKKPMNDRSLPQ